MDFHDASNYLNNKRNRREVEKNREQIKKLEDENAALTKKINGVVSGSGQIEELWSKISNLEAKLKLLSEEFQILKDPENYTNQPCMKKNLKQTTIPISKDIFQFYVLMTVLFP